jgi:hypothetical protein
MKNFEVPVPVIAQSPDNLYVQVMKKIQAGYDMHSPTAPLLGSLVTWMVYVPSIYTYVLVYRKDLERYAADVQSLSARGYDQVFSAFEFKGYACQWMAKEQPSGYAEILRKSNVSQTPVPEFVGLNLVERVQKIPFPLAVLHPYGYKPRGVS